MNSLIEKRKSLLAKNTALLDTAEAEGRSLTSTEDREFHSNINAVDAIDKTLDAGEAMKRFAPSAPGPSLLDGNNKPAHRVMKDLNGKEYRVFERGQSLASQYNTGTGMTLEEFGDGLAAMISGNHHGHRAEIRQISESIDSAGGIMVAEELSSQIVDLARARSIMFQSGALVVPMQSETLRLVRQLTDPTVSITQEGAAITASDPSFDSILLTAKKLATITQVTNETLADAANAGAAIVDSIAASMSSATDDYILAALLANSQISTTGTIGSIEWADILLARLNVRLVNGDPTSILANPNLHYDLSLLTETTTGAFLKPPAQVEDLKWFESTRVSDSTCIVGDPTKVIVGVRSGITLALSADAGFTSDTTYIRAITRLDANVLRPHFRILSGIS